MIKGSVEDAKRLVMRALSPEAVVSDNAVCIPVIEDSSGISKSLKEKDIYRSIRVYGCSSMLHEVKGAQIYARDANINDNLVIGCIHDYMFHVSLNLVLYYDGKDFVYYYKGRLICLLDVTEEIYLFILEKNKSRRPAILYGDTLLGDDITCRVTSLTGGYLSLPTYSSVYSFIPIVDRKLRDYSTFVSSSHKEGLLTIYDKLNYKKLVIIDRVKNVCDVMDYTEFQVLYKLGKFIIATTGVYLSCDDSFSVNKCYDLLHASLFEKCNVAPNIITNDFILAEGLYNNEINAVHFWSEGWLISVNVPSKYPSKGMRVYFDDCVRPMTVSNCNGKRIARAGDDSFGDVTISQCNKGTFFRRFIF